MVRDEKLIISSFLLLVNPLVKFKLECVPYGPATLFAYLPKIESKIITGN